MPPSKYERELRFIDTEVRRLEVQLQAIADVMPADPKEAGEKAQKALDIQDSIASLLRRKREIEQSFEAAGMDLPDIGRSMNATVHNASGFEVHSPEEAESLARRITDVSPEPEMRVQTADDISEEIKNIADELMSVEIRLMRAEIDGDESEMQKLRMMQSSLNARKASLIQTAKELRSEKPAVADDADRKRLDALEADCSSLRTQVSDVRSGLQDVKAQLELIIETLGLER